MAVITRQSSSLILHHMDQAQERINTADVGETELERTFHRDALDLLPSMYSAARVLTGNALAAEDLVATAYARARDSLGDSGGYGSLLVLMLRTLTACVFSGPDDPVADVGIVEHRSHARAGTPNPSLRRVEISNLTERLDAASCDDVGAALAVLPASYRLALWLVDGEGLSHREIAEILDVPAETISSGLSIARTLLAGRLLERRTAGRKQMVGVPDHHETNPTIAPTATPGTPRPQARADGLLASRGDPAW